PARIGVRVSWVAWKDEPTSSLRARQSTAGAESLSADAARALDWMSNEPRSNRTTTSGAAGSQAAGVKGAKPKTTGPRARLRVVGARRWSRSAKRLDRNGKRAVVSGPASMRWIPSTGVYAYCRPDTAPAGRSDAKARVTIRLTLSPVSPR